MKKRTIFIIAIIVILIILLFPIPNKLKDGGSIEFKSLLYNVTKYHKLSTTQQNGVNYINGIKIKILGMEIFNNTKEKIVENSSQENNNYTNTEESFVGTVLEETTQYMIVEPNKDEKERKTADKIKIDYGTDNVDYLYGIGRKVIINYTGIILETYPAQIKTNNISIDGYENFKIEVKASNTIEKKKILNNKDLSADKQDYNLYFYGLDEVNVNVDNKTMSLEDALRSGKITIQGIIKKANKDFPNTISYDDGGSIKYKYEDYSIIKVHKLNGNRDVYIGIPDMELIDLKL